MPAQMMRHGRVRLGLCTSDCELQQEAQSVCGIVRWVTASAAERELAALVGEQLVDVLVVDVSSAAVDPAIIARLSRRCGRVRIIAYCRPGPRLGHVLSSAIRDGASPRSGEGI